MAVHGRFHDKHPHYPLIVGYFEHPSIPHRRPVEFVIDTGADKTFISPDWRYLLDIPESQFQKWPYPQLTMAGELNVECLSNCTLHITGFYTTPATSYSYKFENLCILFSKIKYGILPSLSQWSSRFRKMGKIPCLLGRDVLSKLSLGYCQTSQYLFLTDQCRQYFKVLHPHFPRP